MHILAIDPGAKGGLVYGEYRNPAFVNMPADLDTPEGLIELLDLLVDVRNNFPNVRAVVEKVGGYVGEAQPASSAFKFGGADMAVKAMLVAARIPYVLVAPVTWQRHLDLPKRPRTPKGKAQHKRRGGGGSGKRTHKGHRILLCWSGLGPVVVRPHLQAGGVIRFFSPWVVPMCRAWHRGSA